MHSKNNSGLSVTKRRDSRSQAKERRHRERKEDARIFRYNDVKKDDGKGSASFIQYKSRDESEKLYRADKIFLGISALRGYTDETIEAKSLIGFVALIADGLAVATEMAI